MIDLALVQFLLALPLLFFGIVLAGILARFIERIDALWHNQDIY